MKNVQKFSKNGMPAWDGMFGHVLRYLMDYDGPVERRVIVKEVADKLGMSKQMREKRYKSDNGGNIIENRIAFTLSALKIAKLIDNVKRGVFMITPTGKDYFREFGYQITSQMVESTESFLEHEKQKQKEAETAVESSTENVAAFEIMESIDEMIEEAREKRKEELYEIIINSSPYLFETIVVDLLSQMGYKGKDGKAFQTQKSNDGGIDGFIHHDPLGTQTVFIQAKRYSRHNKVQRPDVESFYGALRSINANRGVFITTSSFTQGAVQSAERLSIVLIEGEKLLDLLVDYEIGIEKDKVFYTYKINEDYFDVN